MSRVELHYLFEENEEIAVEAHGSAFYYGKHDIREWIAILTRMLNEATERGYELGRKEANDQSKTV